MKTIKSTNFDLNWDNKLSDYITAVNWSPDGITFAISSAAGEVKVFVENALIALQEVTNTSAVFQTVRWGDFVIAYKRLYLFSSIKILESLVEHMYYTVMLE